MNIFEENSSSQRINHRKTKRCTFFDVMNCYFTIFEYIICQKQLSPYHCKMLLFALYSNHYMITAKIKIRSDTNHLNSIQFMNAKNLIRFVDFLSYE